MDFLLLGHIGAEGQGSAPLSYDLRPDLLYLAPRAGGDDHGGALAGIGQRHGPSDPAAASGDHRHPSFQFSHAGRLSWSLVSTPWLPPR